MNLLYVYPETIVDGEGIRYSIYLAGCSHHCEGCHNKKSWNPNAGEPLTKDMIDKIVDEINSNPLLDGVTFSGGDPLFNPDEFYELSKTIKERTGKNIWCYTGYTYEEVLSDPRLKKAITYVDVIVEGRFIKSLFSPHLMFRGSSNQRIIRLKDGKIISE